MNNFYVYEWIRLDTNEPFYIGKGKNKRYCQTYNRNKYFMNIYNKVPTKSNIIINNLTENEAFELEKEYINNYRKKYKLSNICDGGEGCSGGTWKLSKEAKENHSKAMIGNKNMLGKQHSEKTKNKMRIKKLNTKASEETKMKLRISHLGQKPWNKGKKISKDLKDDWALLQKYDNLYAPKEEKIIQLKAYDDSIIKNYPQPTILSWQEEGIKKEVCDYHNIRYEASKSFAQRT